MLPDLPGCLAFQGGGRGATHHLHLGGATRGFFRLWILNGWGPKGGTFSVFFACVHRKNVCVCVLWFNHDTWEKHGGFMRFCSKFMVVFFHGSWMESHQVFDGLIGISREHMGTWVAFITNLRWFNTPWTHRRSVGPTRTYSTIHTSLRDMVLDPYPTITSCTFTRSLKYIFSIGPDQTSSA